MWDRQLRFNPHSRSFPSCQSAKPFGLFLVFPSVTGCRNPDLVDKAPRRNRTFSSQAMDLGVPTGAKRETGFYPVTRISSIEGLIN
ncbi:MAG: hypothetical protein ACTSQL_01020 [Promethearchaeota archaeon]